MRKFYYGEKKRKKKISANFSVLKKDFFLYKNIFYIKIYILKKLFHKNKKKKCYLKEK